MLSLSSLFLSCVARWGGFLTLCFDETSDRQVSESQQNVEGLWP